VGSLSLAAVFVLAATAAVVLWRSPGASAFLAVKVTGQADHYHRDRGVWEPLVPGESMLSGDRVVTQGECQVRFDLGVGTVSLDQNTSVEWVSGSKLALDRGRVFIDLHGHLSEPLTVTDTANNSASLREGSLEASLHKLSTWVAGYREEVKGHPSVPPPVREVVLWRLAVRVESGEAYLAGSHEQRLRIVSGQDGNFNPDGQPGTSASPPASVTPWVDPGAQEKK
jgi:hypothetical protein